MKCNNVPASLSGFYDLTATCNLVLLFQDDISERPRMASAISSLANYSAAIPAGPSDPDAKPVVKANLGTLMGVYLPCIQNIFGVILFIRMTWIVGTAGAVQGFFVVFLGCCVVSAALHACRVTTVVTVAVVDFDLVVQTLARFFFGRRKSARIGIADGGATWWDSKIKVNTT